MLVMFPQRNQGENYVKKLLCKIFSTKMFQKKGIINIFVQKV